MGTRVGNTGTLARKNVPLLSGGMYSEAGPVGPCRGRSGWYMLQRPGTSATHPCGARSGTLYPPWWLLEQTPTGLIGSRNEVNSQEVSQNGQVSPESVQKAYVSPYIPKRVQEVTS